MKVIDGTFGVSEEDKAAETGAEMRKMLEDNDVFDSVQGFLILWYTTDGELSIGGKELNHLECVATLEIAKLTLQMNNMKTREGQ